MDIQKRSEILRSLVEGTVPRKAEGLINSVVKPVIQTWGVGRTDPDNLSYQTTARPFRRLQRLSDRFLGAFEPAYRRSDEYYANRFHPFTLFATPRMWARSHIDRFTVGDGASAKGLEALTEQMINPESGVVVNFGKLDMPRTEKRDRKMAGQAVGGALLLGLLGTGVWGLARRRSPEKPGDSGGFDELERSLKILENRRNRNRDENTPDGSGAY